MVVFQTGPTKAATRSASTQKAQQEFERSTSRSQSRLREIPSKAGNGQRERARVQRVAGAKRIRAKELPAFSRQLSAMLLAGIPLVQTLNALEDQTSDKNFKIVIAGLKNYLEGGSSLSEALSHYPTIFDSLYRNMIMAGESGGQLGETAARLAGFLEASAKLSRKVKSAMSYPIIVLCIALGIATAMILFIVPVFGDMFADFGAELPGPTQFMLNLSAGAKKYGIFIVAALIVAVIAFAKWKRTKSGAYKCASVALKFPVLGELNQKVASSRFARTFAHLLQSGVPILRAMEIVAGATGNNVFETVVLNARGTVERGEPLSNALVQYTCFPKLLIHMLAAGEKAGKVDEMMESIAGFYDDEVDAMLEALTSLIEPLLMVFLGVVIGGIVISMFMPIFKMGEIVG